MDFSFRKVASIHPQRRSMPVQPYRILSIDGGGIRGIYAAVLLERLTMILPSALERLDLVAGTSTGGNLALGLAFGLMPKDLVSLFLENAHNLQSIPWRRRLATLGGLTGAKYSNTLFRELLESVFGVATLADLPRRVLVPAFDLDNHGENQGLRVWKPKFFHNFPGPDSDGSERVIDVTLRTSAAPTFLPVYQHFIDGAVVANNPSMAGIAQALDPARGNQELRALHLLSVGTGLNPTYIAGEDLDWGLLQWARPLTRLMIDGVMGVTSYQCTQLLGNRFWRLCPVLPAPVAIDAWNKAQELIDYARAVDLADTVAWLREHF